MNRFIVLPSRTYALDKNRRVEKKGIPCYIKGDEFIVNYASPANLRLPLFGANTSDLTMVCIYEGKKRVKNLKIRNVTSERIAGIGSAGGLIGVVITASIASACGNQSNDDYTYMVSDMNLQRKAAR